MDDSYPQLAHFSLAKPSKARDLFTKPYLEDVIVMHRIIEHVAELTEEDVKTLSASTVLDTLDAWDSLAQVSFLAFASMEFGARLDARDIRLAETIGDLCKLVTGG